MIQSTGITANRVTRIGIYVGSFNPWHIGHMNILEKAQSIFDEVVVGQGWNPEKVKPPKLDASGFEARLRNSRFYQYDGLTTDFMRSVEDRFAEEGTSYLSTTLIRGTRSGHDYEQEITNLRVMEDLAGRPIRIVFIPCDRRLEHISSSMIRQLQALDPELARQYLP